MLSHKVTSTHLDAVIDCGNRSVVYYLKEEEEEDMRHEYV
jgi:hypothetical protein